MPPQPLAKLHGSVLHQKMCPICYEDWGGLLNDLEKVAHLIVCAVVVLEPTRKENARTGGEERDER